MPTFATPGPIAATVQVAGAQVRVTVPGDKTGSVAITIDLPSGSSQVAPRDPLRITRTST